MLFKIGYHLCNLKNVENTHGGVLLLVKRQNPFIMQPVQFRTHL